ncbi:MAG: hypothetical protein FWB95_05825 [Treponema sp.]|nr:hypothetical protein [Treponema sp.]
MSRRAFNKKIKYFRFKDYFAICFFIFVAVLCIDMFKNDLMHTISLQNVEPVGTVVIKKNVVQRRISSRVLWDRLSMESPVYIGDLIRVAEISEATLYIGDHAIDLEENTLIRISLSEDGEGIQVSISEGKIALSAGTQSSNITIDINGQQVKASPGAVLSAGVKENGLTTVQVNEGAATFVADNGLAKEITAGALVSTDWGGREVREKAVVVIKPAPASRFLKTRKEPLSVDFSWNRINLEPEDLLRFEISSDQNFSVIHSRFNNLNNQIQARFDTGKWYWRICLDDTSVNSGASGELSRGALTVADGSALELKTPAANSVFRYTDNYPPVSYQWTAPDEASSYILEVSAAPNFLNPAVYIKTDSAFVTDSSLGSGIWYWRVTPVFPPVYSGSAVFSKTGFFRIEQTAAQVIEAAKEVSFTQWIAEEAPSLRAPSTVPQEIAVEVMPPPAAPPAVSSAPPPVQSTPAPAPEPAAQQQRAQTQAETLLPAAQNLSPARGITYGFNELQSNRNIVFRWAAVRGANAYIFTMYQQTSTGRRQIVNTTINNGTSYTLNDLRLLDRGTFVWQVEAVNIARGSIQRRGRAAENTFVIDYPMPRPVQIEDTGILYGD